MDFSNLIQVKCDVFSEAEHGIIAYTRRQLVHWGHHDHVVNSVRLTGWTCSRIRKLGITNKYKFRGCRAGRKVRSRLERRSSNHSNLVNIELISDHAILKRKAIEQIHIGLVNARSIKSKDILLADYLTTNRVDAVIVTESWLKDTDEDQAWIDQNAFMHSNYKVYSSPRMGPKKGGGLLLAIKGDYHCKLVEHEDRNFWQYAVWKVTFGESQHVTLLSVYRPPASRGHNINDFASDFLEKWAEVNINHQNVIALGDFNIHMDEEDADALSFQSDLDIMGLKQLVSFATHQQGHKLDLVITEGDSHLVEINPTAGAYISDHRFIHMVVQLRRPSVQTIKKTIIKMDNVDMYDLVKEADLGVIYQIEDIDEMVQTFENLVKSALDKLTVKEEKVVPDRKKVPWMTSEVKEQRKIMRNRERIWKKYGDDHQWQAFKRKQKRFKSILRHTKSNVLTAKILDCGRDMKKLFSLVFNITGTKPQNPMPDGESDEELSEKFASFFTKKIQTIVDGLSECHPFEPTPLEVESKIDRWMRPSEDFVKYIVKTMPNKQSELDVIPTSILKRDAQSTDDDYMSLCGALSVIFTRCIEQGVFPSEWKYALVKPLLKEKSLDHEFKNYRPVSNLPFISKVLEKVILTQFSKHMETQQLLLDYQSAYRHNYSCETCLVDLVDGILWNMEDMKCTALSCIDLSAAFDLVDREILLQVLDKRFGVEDKALDLIASYLQPRGFRVQVGKCRSEISELHRGVAQGSCLGPVLYSCFASTIPTVLPSEIDIHGFADDHSFKKAFTPGGEDEKVTITKLESALKSVKHWMDQNRLKMNDGKTEFIIFGSAQKLNKCETNTLDVNSVTITKAPSIKLLGANLDQNLTFELFVKIKCQKSWMSLKRIMLMRNLLTKESCGHLVLTLVITHLDYANSLLAGISDIHLNKLQRVQNAAAKLVLRRSKYDSSTDCLRDLHWLPVRFRIIYKVCMLVYKTLSGEAPIYMRDKLIRKRQSSINLRSNSDIHQLEIPAVRKQTHAARSFSYIGPVWWNQLSIKTTSSLDLVDFKINLKTELFKKAFNI